jgi:hypothetical protein
VSAEALKTRFISVTLPNRTLQLWTLQEIFLETFDLKHSSLALRLLEDENMKSG